MNRVVPTNKLQQQLHKNEQMHATPSVWSDLQVPCLILEVEMPQGDLRRMTARVLLKGGGVMELPFRESAAQILSTYGNAAQLRGKRGIVRFRNNNILNGRVSIEHDVNDIPIEPNETSSSLSIAGVINV